MEYTFTAIATIALVPLYMFLAARVTLYRRTNKISLGDGGDAVLLRRVRAHANFAEYAPIALFILFLNEAQHANAILLYFIAAPLVFGRYVHGYALSSPTPKPIARVAGMAGTFTAVIFGTLGLVGTLIF